MISCKKLECKLEREKTISEGKWKYVFGAVDSTIDEHAQGWGWTSVKWQFLEWYFADGLVFFQVEWQACGSVGIARTRDVDNVRDLCSVISVASQLGIWQIEIKVNIKD